MLFLYIIFFSRIRSILHHDLDTTPLSARWLSPCIVPKNRIVSKTTRRFWGKTFYCKSFADFSAQEKSYVMVVVSIENSFKLVSVCVNITASCRIFSIIKFDMLQFTIAISHQTPLFELRIQNSEVNNV
jgi:hypothetical protein